MSEIVIRVDNFDKRSTVVTTEVFVWRGVAYAIDLGAENAAMMTTDFAKYVAVADRIGPAHVAVNGEDIVKTKSRQTTKSAAAKATAAAPTPMPTPPVPPLRQVIADTPSVPVFTAAEPVPGQLELADGPVPTPEPKDDFPPNKAWLRITKRETKGPGSAAIREQGTRYRFDMRNWLRHNGKPDLGIKGVIPVEDIDRYWDYVVETRAKRRAERAAGSP